MWAQVLNALLGIWLMAAPAVLGYGDPAQTNDRIVGPVIATFAIVAWWEATRGARWVNLPLGLWLVASPWVLGFDATTATINAAIVGLVVAACSLVQGKIKHQFGGGWPAAFRGKSAAGNRN